MADSSDTATIIDNKADLTTAAPIALKPYTPTVLDIDALKLIQTELEACLSKKAEIKMNLKPSTALAHGHILDLKPNGAGF